MKSINSHWISLDVCPVCKSTETFHSEWMKDPELQKVSSTNAYRLHASRTSKSDIAIKNQEAVFSKEDLCLKCGHTWVMYVERLSIDEE